ncbi:MAG: SRPBCC family protein [Propionibacteriaceae bacterium]|nr:SRPBCC family protein [Propionibacteriaceae bacterium]
MAGQSVTVSSTIAAPRERVWEIITDLDQAKARVSAISEIERLTEGPYATGTRWRETRTVFGRAESQELEVVEAIEPERTVVASAAGAVRYVTTMDLAADPVGTLLTVTFDVELPEAAMTRMMARMMGPLGSMFTRKMLTKELDDIRAAATQS